MSLMTAVPVVIRSFRVLECAEPVMLTYAPKSLKLLETLMVLWPYGQTCFFKSCRVVLQQENSMLLCVATLAPMLRS